MENLALIDSFSEFKDEKLIDRVTLMVILEEVFRNTLKRKFGSDENFDIIINPDKGDLEIWRNRVVVKDGVVEDPNQEIELTEARKIEPDFEVGEDVSEEKRIKAAELVTSIVHKINEETTNAKIIVMGDFNDNPTNISVKKYLVNNTFYNPMERLINTGNGTLNHKKKWHLFDQIIFSKNFIAVEKNKHSFKYAEVFDEHFLKEWKGKFKGNPFRTYIGKWYQGGFSDHFPVYVFLKKN